MCRRLALIERSLQPASSIVSAHATSMESAPLSTSLVEPVISLCLQWSCSILPAISVLQDQDQCKALQQCPQRPHPRFPVPRILARQLLHQNLGSATMAISLQVSTVDSTLSLATPTQAEMVERLRPSPMMQATSRSALISATPGHFAVHGCGLPLQEKMQLEVPVL